MVTTALEGGRPTESRHEVSSMIRMLRSHASRMASAAALATALLLTSACGGSGPDTPPAAPVKGASPHAQALSSGASCALPGVHAKHLNAFACATCHPVGATYGFDVPYTFPGGTTTAGGTIVPRTATTPTSCTVACHYPKGAPAKSIEWTVPGPLACTACHETAALPAGHPPVSANATRAECEACHQTSSHLQGTVALVAHAASWTNPASPDFHASSANAGLASCQGCHGQELTGGRTGVSCAQCHDVNLPAGVTSWKVSCTMCHGGTDNATGAPPATTWGHADDPVRAGAHTSHVTASTLAPAFDCGVCHVKPVDALASGHIDGDTASVAFAGLATTTGVAPSWDRAAATCASTYCHGATLSGGTNTQPSWTTVDGSQAACGTCHGIPPSVLHPAVTGGPSACNPCHPATVDASGAVIPPSAGGKHLDGLVEAEGGHAPEWMDPASSAFHARSANASLASCQGCHGQDLAGGTSGLGCGQCHDLDLPAGVASWTVNCTMCHGGTDNPTGAPPRATWGNRTPGDTTNVRIGAHAAHVATNQVSAPFACDACHVKPADALAPGHVDGSTADVRFAGGQGTWDRATATCASTYCHGATLPGGTLKTPRWTKVDGTQDACGTCHARLPESGEHLPHIFVLNIDCYGCHPGTGTWPVSVNPSTHVNGVKEVRAYDGTTVNGWDCATCHDHRGW
jgi:predicted CxxxxCH...CXXCH cytochrome family protein